MKYDLNLLKAFDALYKERNVTRAAQRINISQPAMSAVLTRLRELFNDPLFTRDKFGVSPTEKAVSIHPAIESALDTLDSVVQGLQSFDPLTEKRTFEIAADDYFQIVILPELLKRIREHAPNIKIICSTFTQDLADTGIMSGNTDFAFGRIFNPPENLIVRHAITDTVCCLISSHHSFINKRIGIKQFEACQHIVIKPQGHMKTGLFQQLEARNLKRDIACVVTNFQQVPALLIESDYIALLPKRVCHRFSQDENLRLLQPPFELDEFSLHLGWHRRYQKDPAHQWLRNQISECCQSAAD